MTTTPEVPPAPSAVRLLRAADRAASPWKNGGGVTREIAASPAGAGLDDFAWRISLADVGEGGPFSVFAGIDRVITVVEGAGMELTVDGRSELMTGRGRPFAFPGDADTSCRLLDGPIRDFNVMTRRGRVAAEVEIVREDRELPPADDRLTLLLLVLEGRLRLGAALLDRYDAALVRGTGVTGTASVEFMGGTGAAALVALRDISRP
jgi:environmental stress-induced protein Ves